MSGREKNSGKMGSEGTVGLKREIAALLLLAGAVFTALALFSHNPWDPAITTIGDYSGPVSNWCGLGGALLSDALLLVFGAASYAVPLALAGAALLVFFERRLGLNLARIGASVGFLIVLSTFLSLMRLTPEPERSGGVLGGYLASYVEFLLGRRGGGVVLFAGCIVLFALAARIRLISLVSALLAWGFGVGIRVFDALGSWISYLLERAGDLMDALGWSGRSLEDGYREIVRDGRRVIKTKSKARSKRSRRKKREDKAGNGADGDVSDSGGAVSELDLPAAVSSERGAFVLPPLDLLDDPPDDETTLNREELLENARLLENKLKDFGVFGRVSGIDPGPIITMYEFEPAPGIKVNKIVSLSDDLALALKAVSVRIVAPIPGKAAVGIEIPNKRRQKVYLKEILSSEEFLDKNTPLPLCLGKDISGVPVVADLKKMPHLLVAGATGSGKSVGINSMLASILYRSTPEEVKLLLVDPKMLELSLYEGIPHLLLPVVTDPRKAAVALKWSVSEMERRYRLLADLGVRNIDGYNKKVREVLKKKEGPRTALQVVRDGDMTSDDREGEEHTGPLPHIVIVIDEFADLMMVSSRDVEDSLIRLAQMARAAGLHLILATQRPSVDVITGVIKANFSARISFQVFSRTDSRTILDTSGAEKLLGQGDMLFLPPGTSKLERIHGCYVSDAEVTRLTDFLRGQGKPSYDEEILHFKASEGEAGASDEDHDELYDQALAIVTEQRTASISMIQRRLRIGYNRAARMIERMEREGIVSPAGPGKPREVLIRTLPDT